ncbi:molybdenum cofactor guanylyltransferase [Gracilibacillus sp. S3-1-1]|uniref:Molybdenum cofactor guanylyltransferase n=1 Tax=Gracilibacillus pellucidus TaxID=3095368 RepID=A0ACC6M1J4_9BACI|nr:molybdenum cofactor guanylyltransferase [Gracilibacillus sp. S3-1-1]MDX8044747.1 molybdenum cofactor guanylyltransferase [Gracilibacillus sp. S3-1-1]
MQQIAGILLMGGKSSRFNKDKAYAIYDGKYFYEHIFEVISSHVESTIVVAHDKQKVDDHVQVISDVARFQGQGPLAGIYSAMIAKEAEWYVVLPVDMPFIDSSIIKTLIAHRMKEVNGVVARIRDKIQPLVAVYHRSICDVIHKHLIAEKRSMHSLLDVLRVEYVDFTDDDAHAFRNINTQEEYELYMKE